MRRVVILGLDGLDPNLVEELIEEGSLPNLAKLKVEGSYRRLGTTWPPLSPVAWSSFSTGTNPGKHNIFDFISRDKATYGPMMSSVKIGKPHWPVPSMKPTYSSCFGPRIARIQRIALTNGPTQSSIVAGIQNAKDLSARFTGENPCPTLPPNWAASISSSCRSEGYVQAFLLADR